jgi:hypothetical protein
MVTEGAFRSAPPPAEAPSPAVFSSATTLRYTSFFWVGVAVTVTLVRVVGAVAAQISASPSWVFARFTRLQLRPAPETVAVWPAALASAPTMARSCSPGAEVEKALVVALPLPVALTCWSTTMLPTVAGVVTFTAGAVPVRKFESTACALMMC